MSAPVAVPPLDVEAIRAQFPLLERRIGDKPLVYLDNAATTQKPQAVLDAMDRYYATQNANVHRGVHRLSQEATEAFEAARRQVQSFLHAKEDAEVLFTRGTTEGLNLVAWTWGRANLGAGDEVLVTAMEHHSNIVPWQIVAEMTGATVRALPFTDDGVLDLAAFDDALSERTKLVAVGHVSNALGTIHPVAEIVARAHRVGAVVVVDGAQAAPHVAIDVQALDVDFYAISAHKAYGPTGIGALYGKRALLEAMPPWQGGGEMIRQVTLEGSTWAEIPHKFEAGTPDIAGAIGFGAAVSWMQDVGLASIAAHEDVLLAYATRALAAVPGLRLIGTAPRKASVLSFVMEGTHPHDVGTILDQEGVAIRTGHHCAQPVMAHYGISATARASLAAYTNHAEIDALVEALGKVREIFGT